jgi:hypothetical protein
MYANGTVGRKPGAESVNGNGAVNSNMFPFQTRFFRITSVEHSQEFWRVQVECRNPLVLITGMRPTKPLNVIAKRATAVTPVDLGIEDRCKLEMFITIDNFDGTRQRLFAAWERIRKVRFKC